MAKTVTIPEYLLVNMLRHYKVLASVKVGHDNLRAINAQRLAHKEIKRIEKYIEQNDGEHRP